MGTRRRNGHSPSYSSEAYPDRYKVSGPTGYQGSSRHNSDRYEGGGTAGLVNIGNTCFMNSILQCLSNTRQLKDYCLSSRYVDDLNPSSSMKGNLMNGFIDLIKQLWDPDQSAVTPQNFKKQIQKFSPRFTGYEQQDSQEFLRFLLEGLHEEINRVKRKSSKLVPEMSGLKRGAQQQQQQRGSKQSRVRQLERRGKRVIKQQNAKKRGGDRLLRRGAGHHQQPPSSQCNFRVAVACSAREKAERTWEWYKGKDDSFIFDLFVGQLESSLQCHQCKHVSLTFDPFWDLSLPVAKKMYGSSETSVDDCLQNFTKEEVLDDDEKPMCDKCKVRRRMTKRLSVHKFPTILVLHLKRFSEGSRFRQKLGSMVKFPLRSLDLTPYASDHYEAEVASPVYDLYAVSNHMGSCYGGHYTAYCCNPHSKQWNNFNDSSVKPMSESSVCTKEAYVLFYQLRRRGSSRL